MGHTLPVQLHRCTKSRGEIVPVHAHDDAQLAFSPSGMMQVVTTAGRWLVPAQLAVWTPAQDPHRLEFLSDAELCVIYCRPEVVQAWAGSQPLDRSFALRVTPLLRTLIAAIFEPDTMEERAELIIRLLFHELSEAPDAPAFVPVPTSAVGRRVADLAFADVRNRLSMAELASRGGTSVRTISRLFPAETGMTFRAWRQRARIARAIDGLSRGDAIARVSADVGFANSAAFGAAFRSVTATTPAAFRDGRKGS